MQPIPQVYLEILYTRLRTWGVNFSWTIEALNPWIIYKFRI